MRGRRRSRLSGPGLERLEPRSMLSGVEGVDPAPEVADPLPDYDPIIATSGLAPAPRTNAKGKPKEVKISRLTTEIYGIVLPAREATKGKTPHGVALVSADVVWLLDVSSYRGLSSAARVTLRQPTVAIGTGEITKDATGEIKRKFKVTWMEPLQGAHIAPARLSSLPIPPRFRARR